VRRERSERMRSLWQTGKLRPRRRKVQVQVIERWKRPSVVVVGEGIMQRSHPITWREGEGVASCPVCGSSLKVQ